jgi:mannose-6-phosphate isomerase-like protein (cupin superfamily)
VSGRLIQVKVSGADTGGDFALFEVPAAPNVGPGLHMHHVENECFYVLEGELDIQVGTEIVRLGPGGSVYAPRLIPHTWQPAGGKDVRFLSLAQPAGNLEAFLHDLSGLQERGALTPAELKALFLRHDMELVGPPLKGRP